LPSIVPFARSETSFTRVCIYPIFPSSSGTTSFFPSFGFPVDHNFWQSHWVHSLNMAIQNELFSVHIIHRISYQAVPLQAFTGPAGSRRLRLPDFKTIDTWTWCGCQPYEPESSPGP
jgi:hypothetical protein